MYKIGFIGFGSMGSMLIKGFINSGQINQDGIIVTRKDKSRLGEIKDTWPNVEIAQEVIEVVKKAHCIFICAKPMEYKGILDEIKSHILPDHHIISIAGSIELESMERIINCKITKVMPTIISEVNEGISLVCHNSKVTYKDADLIESLVGSIGNIRRISEKDFEFASELTSCGPGLLAAVFQEFVEAGLRHANSMKKEDIEEMVLKTAYGTAKLMLEKNMNFGDVISRVATKGGITEEGVKVIKGVMPQVFDEMFEQTMIKRKIVSQKVCREFGSI
ncbi:MAG: NAD(P)-binding domain-containing protein [Clostridia bacterium]|nr:NAD(P)-binding domain-containing protein [Clostridia bacterium]